MYRYSELDSLRGLAALTVLIGHFLNTLPIILENKENVWIVNLFKFTPLHIFWAGHEAVILFFIISGFVLSLPFYSNNPPKYLPYIIKRVCRIYIPYIFVVILAITTRYLFFSGDIENASNWFNGMWHTDISFKLFLQHFFLLGNFDSNSFNTVIWSLVHEMRISIIFPFIIFFILRFNWKITLVIGFLFSCTFAVLGHLLKPANGTHYIFTLHYIFMFILGALLSRNRAFLIDTFKGFNILVKIITILVAVLFYTFPWLMRGIGIFDVYVINDWATSIGAILFILIVLSFKKASKILHNYCVMFLGKISYSLYLYHIIILNSLMHVLNKSMSITTILLIALLVSLITSTVSYYIIEAPSITIGRKLSSKLSGINKKINRKNIA